MDVKGNMIVIGGDSMDLQIYNDYTTANPATIVNTNNNISTVILSTNKQRIIVSGQMWQIWDYVSNLWQLRF
jgi:hypothetical protein